MLYVTWKKNWSSSNNRISWCSRLSRLSNTQTVAGSNPAEIIFFVLAQVRINLFAQNASLLETDGLSRASTLSETLRLP